MKEGTKERLRGADGVKRRAFSTRNAQNHLSYLKQNIRLLSSHPALHRNALGREILSPMAELCDKYAQEQLSLIKSKKNQIIMKKLRKIFILEARNEK